MINLGFHSGKQAPEVHYYPNLLDRVLEGIALVELIAMWGGYFRLREEFTPAMEQAIIASLLCLLVGASAYFPIRYINFPVKITRQNVAMQYTLVIRLCRMLNITLTGMMAASVFMEHSELCETLFYAALLGMAGSLVAYFILAFRYK